MAANGVEYPAVDQGDVQGNVLAGYGFDQAVFIFLRVTSAAAGRAWLGELLAGELVEGGVTSAHPFGEGKPDQTLNLAFTHDGLHALGVAASRLAEFPEEFRDGMAARAETLGDTGPNAPTLWESGLRAGEPHVLVTINSNDEKKIGALREKLRQRVAAPGSGLLVVHELPTGVLDRSEGDKKKVFHEHFGFADGLAQPSIAGVAADDPGRRVGPTQRDGQGTPDSGQDRWKPLAPGEFLLGHPDENGVIADRPEPPLLANGTYMVVRKLRQDVALFYNFMRRAADGDPDREELLSAKVVGRWRDGTPLVLSPTRQPHHPSHAAPPPTDFRYDGDGDGRRCPIGAHVRRANPRDCAGFFEGRLSARHRMIRRGMPYGPKPDNPYLEDGRDRGLMFVCYQANIARQFEVVQGRWLADGDAFGLGREQDFLLGTDDPHGKLTVQGDPPDFLAPQRAFVINRGGGYFFVPGLTALDALARGLQ